MQLTEVSKSGFAPVSTETGSAIELAMEQLWLDGEVLPFGARLRVRHRFRSAERRPLEVIYAFALPRDAALRRFRVAGDGFAVRSELRKVDEARRTYEQALESGHLATLAQQYGDGLVNLTLGNLRPGEAVAVYLEILAGVENDDKGFRFRFPFTLAPGYHSRARVADGGEIELPEDEFGDLVLPLWREDSSGLHQVGFHLKVSMPCPIRQIGSPSHAVRITYEEGRSGRVMSAAAMNAPDRDLILDAHAAESLSGVLAGLDKTGRGRFVALIPSEQFGSADNRTRRVVFVLDRSGSMAGAPVEQARRAIEACLGAFSADDEFGIVAFDNQVEAFAASLVPATRQNRSAARDFLQGIDARGGTELAAGVLEAARLLGSSGGDILVVTDGQVFGTETILARVRKRGIRVHSLGIGAASQDRFLSLLARQTGGVSRFVSPGERVDLPALELFGSIGRPVATGVTASVSAPGGRIEVEPARTVFAGTPLAVFGSAAGPAQAHLQVQCDDEKRLKIPFTIAENRQGELVRLLTGARLLTDLDSEAEQQPGAVEARLEQLSLEYGLASRAMALVAVVERPGDEPGAPPATRVVPVGLPCGVKFESYFRPAFSGAALPSSPPPAQCARAQAWELVAKEPALPMISLRRSAKRLEDELVSLAAAIEPDGGLPGATEEERLLATLLALLRFLGAGWTAGSAAFGLHVDRLVAFLEAHSSVLADERRQLVEAVVELARAGESLPGDWENVPAGARAAWRRIRRALRAAGRI
jgi:Ca-activated chloride channel family protein